MKEITILSGKGGAGKTSVAAAIASVAENAVFCDNDVDAADLHLIFNPEIKEKYDFDSGTVAVIDPAVCTNCGICAEHCHFDAIHPNSVEQLEVNPFQCEGCRLCERVCPENAIESIRNNNNHWFVSDTRFGTLVHAKMGPGEENSGKLVTEIRKKAKEIANNTRADFIVNDGPPGIGCSAIASVTGTDAVLMVIEPTLSGLHDAKRLVELIKTFNIPVYAVINKYDLNSAITEKVKNYLTENGILLVGKIPFAQEMVESVVNEKTIIEYAPELEISKTFYSIWNKVINN